MLNGSAERAVANARDEPGALNQVFATAYTAKGANQISKPSRYLK